MDTSPWQIIFEQLETMLVYLARPIVQRQLTTLVILFLLAWFVPKVSHNLLPKNSKAEPRLKAESTRRQRWLFLFYELSPPLLSLILTQSAIWVFRSGSHPFGLLSDAMRVFWLWLLYKILLLGVYRAFGKSARPYHHWVLFPVFIGAILFLAFENQLGFRFLAEISLFSIFGFPITFGNLLSALVLLYVFVISAWIVEIILRKTLTFQTSAEPGLIDMIARISRYTIISSGIVVVLGVLGVDLTTLAIIGGGLSVGIGFGLQTVIANFTSGIVLLFEQIVRPGDVVDIEGEIGIVEKLNMRATIVRTMNNVEIIIPNADFLTTRVTSLTKTDTRIRLLIPFGVSYDSDPQKVRDVVLNTISKHGLLLKEPVPTVLFKGFGDSSLDFDLAVWVDQPRKRVQVQSDIYYMLFSAFAKHDIEIPFPQHDLNLRHGWDKISTDNE